MECVHLFASQFFDGVYRARISLPNFLRVFNQTHLLERHFKSNREGCTHITCPAIFLVISNYLSSSHQRSILLVNLHMAPYDASFHSENWTSLDYTLNPDYRNRHLIGLPSPDMSLNSLDCEINADEMTTHLNETIQGNGTGLLWALWRCMG